jgi:hypothetical protein
MTETTIITENLTDGTTAVIEITTLETDASVIEDVIEALTDDGDVVFEAAQDEDIIEAEADAADLTIDDFELASDPIAAEVFSDGEFHLASDDIAAEVFNNGEFHLASDEIAAEVFGGSPNGTTYEEMAQSAGYESTAPDATTASTIDEVTDSATLEAEAHAEVAAEAQAAADEFVAAGDYAAAAEAREVAENEAWAAGDQYILHGSDSTDLETAVNEQENAEYYEQQQALHAQQGDYEAAREDSSNAAYATFNADWNAGGADHTGQADAEYFQMGLAVSEEQTADYYAQSAEQAAVAGDYENAEYFADLAADHQETADYHGDLGEHGGEIGVYDNTSVVETGGSYEAADSSSSYDYSATDTATE